ncbi:MAG: endo alpha-1,4 polygalactosaminidase [Granulosicoccus sp.]
MNSLAFFRSLSLVALLLWLSGCSVFSTSSGLGTTTDASRLSLSTQGNWLLGEFVNNSKQYAADSTLSALLETHLRETGVLALASTSADAHYRIAGHIDRWTYLAGAAPRPAITVYLSVFDAESDRVLWSDERDVVGSRRESLTVLADRVLADLVQQMPIDDSQLEGIAKADDLLADLDYLNVISPTADNRATGVTLSGGALALRGAGKSIAHQRVRTDRPLHGRSTAFYYAAQPPVDILSQFDRLVLEPDNISADQLAGLGSHGAITFAYLSIGEVGPSRSYAKDINSDWIVGKNAAWGSSVLDLGNSDLRGFLLSRVGELARSGYHGVFLDTMDSYYLAASTDEEIVVQQDGLISLIRSIAARYPDMRIIVNRGFEVLDDIAVHIEAVAAESLFASWDNATASYGGVPEQDREWLFSKLEYARALNLDVIAIDYVPPEQRDRARQVASEIARLGYVPWVATPGMDYVGVGALEVVPREVLMIYDSEIDGPMYQTKIHTLLAMPLEYMGYVPRYLDIAKEPLPAGELKGRFAGVVMWPEDRYSRARFKPWLVRQLESRVPVAFLQDPPSQSTGRWPVYWA